MADEDAETEGGAEATEAETAPDRPEPTPETHDVAPDVWIALLMPIVALVPILAELRLSADGLALLLTAFVAAALFAILRVHQGYRWPTLQRPMLMTLVVFVLAVPALLSTADVALVFTIVAVGLSLYALWMVYADDHPLPDLLFIVVAIMVGGGVVARVVDNAVVALAALVLVFAWPLTAGAAASGGT